MPTYNVYRDGEQIASGLTEKTYTDTGLEPNKTYEYRVSAENEAGESDLSEPIEVTIKPIEVTSVTLSQKTMTLEEGATKTLTATVEPENATDKTVRYTTSDREVATVSTSGEVRTVTGVKAGTATITARAGEQSDVCTVTVKAPPPPEPDPEPEPEEPEEDA
ncbi:Ig-like domain-containing protein [Shouchella clausii]|uniref:Ig-like domain-containing protein n=1 Tax=Shouchella clausii TaxID=79880 RepID=UPI0026F42152|nr:Ig-like domain-containing protein [Shouchella clausii]MDO7281734.1 Ig-like domain-containing protein [Shouchella clausii]MDO7301829.1 Ig-like domain-containing protein [Shouchella clausii]